MTASTPNRRLGSGSRALWKAASITAVVAVVIDLIIFGIAAAIWNVPGNFSQVNAASVIIVPIISVIIAAIGFAVIAHISERPLMIFTVLAVIVTILSLGSPLTAMTNGMSGEDPVTTSTGITMFVLHLVTGSLIAFGFPTILRRRRFDV